MSQAPVHVHIFCQDWCKQKSCVGAAPAGESSTEALSINSFLTLRSSLLSLAKILLLNQNSCLKSLMRLLKKSYASFSCASSADFFRSRKADRHHWRSRNVQADVNMLYFGTSYQRYEIYILSSLPCSRSHTDLSIKQKYYHYDPCLLPTSLFKSPMVSWHDRPTRLVPRLSMCGLRNEDA